MNSLRSIVRAAPRSPRAFIRTRPVYRFAPLHRTLPTPWRLQKPAAFSTSISRHESDGTNHELSAKIDSEISIEKDMRDPNAQPDPVKEYLANTPFQLHDSPGQQEVVLTRTYGDEKIRVTFSCDDYHNLDEESDAEQDEAMQDEFEDSADLPTDTQSGGANAKGSINQGNTQGGNFRVAPEDSVASSDQEGGEGVEEGQQDQEPNFPARVLVTIERPNKGTLQVATTAQDGMMGVESIYYFKDPRHVDPKNTTDEANAARLYTGPPYAQLDDDLQVLFEKYLDERGINTTLALFVTEYIDYKEMREYLNWLKNVKEFVN